MISVIVYILHYYILPRKVYEGLYCLEEFAAGQRDWANTFYTANVIDVAICCAILIVTIINIFMQDETSSEESES